MTHIVAVAEREREFICADCNGHVLTYLEAQADNRCLICSWIRKHVPPEHQTDARERLGVPLKAGAALPRRSAAP